MKNITVLGVTGSIGMQTVDVVKNHLDKFKIVAMSAGYNIKQVEEILEMIDVEYVCVVQKKDAQYLQEKYPDLKVTYGQEGLIKIATLPQIDIVLNAIVGFAGLVPTIEAIKAKKDIALANKETLVVAGHIITKLVKENNVRLLPVDSEHSAIFQSLNGEKHQQIKRIILTASGGSFRDKSRDELIGVTVEEALNHPNWSMGAKITIDSATLFNKGLEVIEAKWLFDVSYDQIDVLIHPESIIHSMVEFVDTSVIGQLGNPDMRLPIQYALTYPDRDVLVNGESLDLAKIASLTFKKPDLDRFKALALAYKAGRTGGSMPCVLNGANEMANELFRNNKIEFLQIEELVEKALKAHQVISDPTLEQLVEVDSWARNFVLKEIGED
ncbi:1-deoxy-D-xylulose-5-phosphate reductoisomerase [Erysipelatoclostridium sp. An15]|uniref:1-deoxy-D-xylulose-5-phosphate reductoisomerase n=1 Tax=unclassified Thomasclavelia TaxID=3025756 RepID=UPI000B39D994|nr:MULTISPECIES: 1-deoxy-D-xylulose-5-phosphate reductoisomerase [unclassified Thomasclavelia]OUP79077.1 1-deoxy-D-xylulose-5-phosphate reductoisomerase [Erysipelatoclostridium sp. An173]OUQ09299.1 1-deoxy-D-xylulose-5-phosphate reductoisomerase [Erysipelatoclostridium sp. An15]